MFRGGQPNPYDDIVVKTTDENLTGENWELILNLCDKVQDEGESGARNVFAAILKRLAHRNANVQLYALTLAEALSKNCGIQVHREIASRAFTQGLEKIIMDRTTHDKVKRRALSLIAIWTAEFEKDPSLGIMEECYTNLKAKHYKFDMPEEAPPPDVDVEARRREEEELQRALEMSVMDKGGRQQWAQYSPAAAAGSSSAAAGKTPAGAPSSSSAAALAHDPYRAPTYSGGYAPARTPSPKVQKQPPVHAPTPAPTTYTAVAAPSPPPPEAPTSIVTRVRALHTFEPTEAGELGFEKGDVIKVVDRGYKDWWRGQLKGRTGIFPVNYVEPLPEPTTAELAKMAEQEAAVFSQAANVDKLLTMLREFDSSKDNLADNEEIQELYRTSMGLRPKIVKLIDKYSQKKADLVSMNESFVKARSIYDRMMEQSLAKLSEGPYGPPQARYQPGPDSRAYGPQGGPPGPQPYGWNGYSPYPAAPGQSYGPGPDGPYAPGPPQQQQQQPHPQPSQYPPQPYVDPNAQGPPQQQQQPYLPYAPQQPGLPYGAPNVPPGGYAQAPGQPPAPIPQGAPTPAPHLQHAQSFQPAPQSAPTPAPHLQHVQSFQAQGYPQAQPQPQAQAQPQPQAQAQPQPQQQPQQQQQPQPQPEAQQQQQGQGQAAPLAGPPFVYDPNATYEDPNVQAWAKYYAVGGTDPTGSVYFISVPGVKEVEGVAGPGAGGAPHVEDAHSHAQPHTQPQFQPQPVRQNSGHTTSPTLDGAPAPGGYVQYQPMGQPQDPAGYAAQQPGASLSRNTSAAATAPQGQTPYPGAAQALYQARPLSPGSAQAYGTAGSPPLQAQAPVSADAPAQQYAYGASTYPAPGPGAAAGPGYDTSGQGAPAPAPWGVGPQNQGLTGHMAGLSLGHEGPQSPHAAQPAHPPNAQGVGA